MKKTPSKKYYNYITTKSFTNEMSSTIKEIKDADYEKSMNKLYTRAQIS